jgi:PAS domain S-box-containing protein
MSAGSQRTIKELIINNGIPPVYEHPLFKKNGKKKIISWQNTTLIGNNSQLMHISFGIDITDQKESDKKLQDSEARFKKLIQNSGDIFAIVDRNLNIKCISNSVERVTGFSTSESIDTNIFDIIHPEDIPKIRELIVNGADVPNYIETIVYRRKRRDGSYIYMESVVQNLYHDDLIQGVLINSRDVTERRQYEMKLKELNATKDKLFSIIAHDLRGPIGNSALLLEMMANEQINFEPEEKSAMLKEHSGALKNTGRLLENLLDWARSQKNDVRIEKKNIDLNRFIEECFDILKMQARKKNITLKYHNPHQANIFADERMMKTVIRNLVSNALKFSYENGTVRIIVENENGGARISVCDEGVGMSEDKIEKLFKITGNISTNGTRGENGTGLGLILCHEFIEKNGGTISVKSEPEKGSTFIMSFPPWRAAGNVNCTQTEKTVRQCSKFAEPLNILIAEDDISTQHLIEKIFKIKGWKPRFANNGLEVVESYGKAQTDIILMDINMPLMNGIAAMNEIRKIENGSGAKTPIIAFTTFNSHEEIESYLKCGFDDYAPKPVHVNILFEKIESNIIKKICSPQYCMQYRQGCDRIKYEGE